MPEKVEVDYMADAIKDLLEEYGEEVNTLMADEFKQCSKDGAARLKKISPKDDGDYAKGWKAKNGKTNLGPTLTIYNATRGWLTMLLEHGHAKRDGGRTKAQPHIKPTQEYVEKEIFKRLKEGLSK